MYNSILCTYTYIHISICEFVYIYINIYTIMYLLLCIYIYIEHGHDTIKWPIMAI